MTSWMLLAHSMHSGIGACFDRPHKWVQAIINPEVARKGATAPLFQVH